MERTPTVIFVANKSWNLYNFRKPVIQHFLALKINVVIAAPKDDWSLKLVEMGCEFVNINIDCKGKNPLSDFVVMLKLYQLYRTMKPTCVFHFTIKPNIYGNMAARWANVPSINTITGLGTVFLQSTFSSWLAQKMYAISLFRHGFTLFQNHDDRVLFIKKGIVQASNTGYVPGSGIDTQHFYQAPLNSKSPFVISLMARLLVDKGIREYIQAIVMFQKQYGSQAAIFQLIGDLDTNPQTAIPESDLQQWIEDGLINYLPFKNDVRPYIESSTLVVLPSYREGLSKSLLESAAMGRPLVATDVPGCREVCLTGQNGVICEVKNATSLFNALCHVYEMELDELKRMGEHSRQLVEQKFSSDKVNCIYEEHFNKMRHKS
jgi:glycosyltransferase involved in cell wall biosynthesis